MNEQWTKGHFSSHFFLIYYLAPWWLSNSCPLYISYNKMLNITRKVPCFIRCKNFSTSSAVYAKKKASKKDAPTEKVLLGRPSNNLSMGVVGLPNIGYYINMKANE